MLSLARRSCTTPLGRSVSIFLIKRTVSFPSSPQFNMPLDFLTNDFIFPCEPEAPKLMSGPDVKVPESVNWSFQATQDCILEYTIVSSGRIPGAFEFQLKTDSEFSMADKYSFSETSSIYSCSSQLQVAKDDLKYAQHEIENINQTYHADEFQGSFAYSSSSSTHTGEDGLFSDADCSMIHDSATESDIDSVTEVCTSPATKYPLLSFDSQGSTLVSSTNSICSTDKVQKDILNSQFSPVTLKVSRSNFNINTRSLQDLVGKFKKQKDPKLTNVSKAPMSVTQRFQRFQRFLGLAVY
ncbi:hypothetical protein CLU79DRAFT_210047 [Phycomyces nitens]|nr:hypothetical protein CLU79DRAFT_210047 [Phycomyces nitens]